MSGHPLDSPVWNALGQIHERYGIDYGDARFYKMPFATFGAIEDENIGHMSLIEYAKVTNPLIIVGILPASLPNNWKVLNAAHCAQMICDELLPYEVIEEIVSLDHSHKDELFALIDLVQPGYFFSETQSLGQYFGIFKDGKLVAAAGERLKLHQYTEVSGVVTHPDYTKQGYATQLVHHVTNHILLEGKLPFLHVLETNSKAIAIYHKLGYHTRRQMIWYKLGI